MSVEIPEGKKEQKKKPKGKDPFAFPEPRVKRGGATFASHVAAAMEAAEDRLEEFLEGLRGKGDGE